MKDVGDKIFLVTGGAMGMGKLVAERFAADGATVVLWDLDEARLAETAEEFKKKGWPVHTYVIDVTDRLKVYETAERVRNEVGVVDVLMNNAGVIMAGPFLEVDDEWHRKTMDVNVNAYMWMMKAFMPDMVARNEGHIINIASAAGVIYVPLQASYCASKSAVINLTDSVRAEMQKFKKKGVRLTIICPFFVKTGMFEGAKKLPLTTRLLEPEFMADKIYMAYHKNRNYLSEPLMVKIVPLLRALSVTRVVNDWCWNHIFRGYGVMDEWTGRQGRRRQ